MDTGKTLAEIYHFFSTLEESHLAKHTIAALILGIFEKLESSGTEVTPLSIEKALKEELSRFSLKSTKKKKSA